MRPMRSLVWMLALAACGGGGDDGDETPPPANRAPSFTSATTVSVAENGNGTVYTATATDPDGNALTFAIAGGADAARLRISANGVITFAAPPDFEAPGDADANNVYLVQLSVSDGTASATLDLAITVTNAGTDAFRVRRAGSGFNEPLYLTAIPDGTGRVFVVEKGGRIRILNPATGAIAATPFLTVASEISTDGERGLLGLATAPDFATSGAFYVYLTNTAGNIEVRRYTTTANRDVADGSSADTILTVPHPGANNHYGGWIDFGPDGNLYVATGDGGGSGDPNGNAQNSNSLLGKILRINVRSDGFLADSGRDYAIPLGNLAGGAPEVWLLGLRNPFRASFDSANGNLYIGDVGQDAIEEIDFVPAGGGGLNFGWNRREGTQAYNGGANSPGFTPPVAEYSRGTGPTQGRSVTGGYVYRGPVESLRGLYFFGDFISANFWTVPASQLVQGQTVASSAFVNRRATFTPNAGTIGSISSFGTDQSGNLYIVDYGGEIFVIEAG